MSKGVRAINQTKRVKGTTGVQTLGLARRTITDTVSLSTTHHHNMEAQEGNDGLGMDQTRGTEIVKTAIREDMGPAWNHTG